METTQPIRDLQEIPISQIEPDPNQPRKDLDLPRLVSSIREFGLYKPITVRPNGDNFIIIVGERRFRGCKELNHETIAAFIDESGVDPAITRMVLDTHGKDYKAVEEAELYWSVQQAHGFSNQQLAEWSDKSKSHISGILKLAALSDADKEKVRRAELSTRDAIKIAQKSQKERDAEFRRLAAPPKKAAATKPLKAPAKNKKTVGDQTREIERLKKDLPVVKIPDQDTRTEVRNGVSVFNYRGFVTLRFGPETDFREQVFEALSPILGVRFEFDES